MASPGSPLAVVGFSRGYLTVFLSAYLHALVILPEVLDVRLRQALVGAVGLLPSLEAASENAHLLRHRHYLPCAFPLLLPFLFSGMRRCCGQCLLALHAGALGRSDRVLAELCLALSYVSKCGAGPALLRQGAVEDDGLGVLELAQQGWQPLVELVRGYPAGALDVPAYVVCGNNRRSAGYHRRRRHCGKGARKLWICVPPSRTSITAIELSGDLSASSSCDSAVTSMRGRLAIVNLDMLLLRIAFMGLRGEFQRYRRDEFGLLMREVGALGSFLDFCGDVHTPNPCRTAKHGGWRLRLFDRRAGCPPLPSEYLASKHLTSKELATVSEDVGNIFEISTDLLSPNNKSYSAVGMARSQLRPAV